MLGRPGRTGISIKAIFDTAVEVRADYGTTSGVYTDSTLWQSVFPDSTGEAVAVVNLTGLLPDTKYFYKLRYRKPGSINIVERPEYTFHTARPQGESFTFTVQADPHLDAQTDTALYRRCLRNQFEDAPDFMIELGDFLMTDKLKDSSNHVPEDTIPYRCKLLRSFYESLCHSVPLYIVLGNHEGEAGWYNNGTSKNMAVWDTKYRKKYFMNPVPDNFYAGDTTHYNYVGQREAYYSWEWGDALFIVLDPYWNTKPKPDSLNCWRWALGKQQYDWLKYTLESSSSTFKFVFIHQLVGGNAEGRGGAEWANFYEWGGQNIDSTDGWAANRPGWYKPIKELLKENHVNIFFHGHDHLFAEQQQNCLIYQEVPQPGLPSFNNIPQAIDYGYLNGVIIPNSGHLRVRVSPDSVTVDYVRALRPSQETGTLHNKDISESYSIGAINCYDTLQNGFAELPDKNELRVNVSPNPFNIQTLVNFSLQKADNVSITLHDFLGREVAVIFDDHCQPGSFSIPLNSNEPELKSGIYYLRITSGNEFQSMKIVCIH